jgi:hypothetical protein
LGDLADYIGDLGRGLETSPIEGIKFDQDGYFEFDPETITVEGVNKFLTPIGGSIRLW